MRGKKQLRSDRSTRASESGSNRSKSSDSTKRKTDQRRSTRLNTDENISTDGNRKRRSDVRNGTKGNSSRSINSKVKDVKATRKRGVEESPAKSTGSKRKRPKVSTSSMGDKKSSSAQPARKSHRSKVKLERLTYTVPATVKKKVLKPKVTQVKKIKTNAKVKTKAKKLSKPTLKLSNKRRYKIKPEIKRELGYYRDTISNLFSVDADDCTDGFELPNDLKPKPPAKFKMISSNVYSKGISKLKPDMENTPKCACVDTCDSRCYNKQLFMECMPHSCPSVASRNKNIQDKSKHITHCENTCIQRQAYPKTRVIYTSGKGYGLENVEPVKKGTIIEQYCGQVITSDQLKERLSTHSSSHFYFAALEGNLTLDALKHGSVARFVNHSCQPNCKLEKWTVAGVPHIVIVAAYDLPAYSELSYNYNADTLNGMLTPQVCCCGASGCSGTLGGKVVGDDIVTMNQQWVNKAELCQPNPANEKRSSAQMISLKEAYELIESIHACGIHEGNPLIQQVKRAIKFTTEWIQQANSLLSPPPEPEANPTDDTAIITDDATSGVKKKKKQGKKTEYTIQIEQVDQLLDCRYQLLKCEELTRMINLSKNVKRIKGRIKTVLREIDFYPSCDEHSAVDEPMDIGQVSTSAPLLGLNFDTAPLENAFNEALIDTSILTSDSNSIDNDAKSDATLEVLPTSRIPTSCINAAADTTTSSSTVDTVPLLVPIKSAKPSFVTLKVKNKPVLKQIRVLLAEIEECKPVFFDQIELIKELDKEVETWAKHACKILKIKPVRQQKLEENVKQTQEDKELRCGTRRYELCLSDTIHKLIGQFFDRGNEFTNGSKKDKVKLYCFCQLPEQGGRQSSWNSCEECEEWYHPYCINLSGKEAKAIGKFICPLCQYKKDLPCVLGCKPVSAAVKRALASEPQLEEILNLGNSLNVLQVDTVLLLRLLLSNINDWKKRGDILLNELLTDNTTSNSGSFVSSISTEKHLSGANTLPPSTLVDAIPNVLDSVDSNALNEHSSSALPENESLNESKSNDDKVTLFMRLNQLICEGEMLQLDLPMIRRLRTKLWSLVAEKVLIKGEKTTKPRFSLKLLDGIIECGTWLDQAGVELYQRLFNFRRKIRRLFNQIYRSEFSDLIKLSKVFDDVLSYGPDLCREWCYVRYCSAYHYYHYTLRRNASLVRDIDQLTLDSIKVKPNIPDEVYCICLQPDSGTFMIECNVCKQWFHPQCCGLHTMPKKAIRKLDTYTCVACCEIVVKQPYQFYFGKVVKPVRKPKPAVEQAVERSEPQRIGVLPAEAANTMNYQQQQSNDGMQQFDAANLHNTANTMNYQQQQSNDGMQQLDAANLHSAANTMNYQQQQSNDGMQQLDAANLHTAANTMNYQQQQSNDGMQQLDAANLHSAANTMNYQQQQSTDGMQQFDAANLHTAANTMNYQQQQSTDGMQQLDAAFVDRATLRVLQSSNLNQSILPGLMQQQQAQNAMLRSP